jgi:DNA polymerase
MGPQFKLLPSRGQVLPSPVPDASHVVATVHPSSVLRAPDSDARREALEGLVADLKVVAKLLKK